MATAFVRKVTVTDCVPPIGDLAGAASYDVFFEVGVCGSQSNFKVRVSTKDGYRSAMILACQALRKDLIALAREVEKQESGPHAIMFGTREDTSEGTSWTAPPVILNWPAGAGRPPGNGR